MPDKTLCNCVRLIQDEIATMETEILNIDKDVINFKVRYYDDKDERTKRNIQSAIQDKNSIKEKLLLTIVHHKQLLSKLDR